MTNRLSSTRSTTFESQTYRMLASWSELDNKDKVRLHTYPGSPPKLVPLTDHSSIMEMLCEAEQNIVLLTGVKDRTPDEAPSADAMVEGEPLTVGLENDCASEDTVQRTESIDGEAVISPLPLITICTK